MRRKDEYDEIYLQDGDFGLEYTYKNHCLGKENTIQPDDIKTIGTSKHNDDEVPLFIKCGNCGIHMDYIHSLKGPLTGRWICPNCGTYVRELTVYNHIDKMNNTGLMDDDYDDIY